MDQVLNSDQNELSCLYLEVLEHIEKIIAISHKDD